MTLTVTATGSAPLAYQWYRDGLPIDGATAASYDIASAIPADGGRYSVKVSNDFGEAVLGIGSDIVGIDGGAEFSVLLDGDGILWANGRNDQGQLGASGPIQFSNPIPLAKGVAAASAGSKFVHFIDGDGTLWAMGDNANGQLGNGNMTDWHWPDAVATSVAEVISGGFHTLFRKTDDTLWGTGGNYSGQLGIGNTTNQVNPIQIDTDVIAMAAGASHSLYIKSDHTLWAMGQNNWGQLGVGDSTDRDTPVQVDSDVIAVAAGEAHTLYLKSDNTLWAVGKNGSGQLGLGDTTERSAAVQVTGNVIAIAAGKSHSLFIKDDNTLWAMGANASGQLGDGTTDNSNSPVQIASDVALVAAGDDHSLFVDLSGTPWGMGENQYARLGDGSSTDRLSPVKIGLGANRAARLTVDVPAGAPLIVSQPVDQDLVVDATIEFSVVATGDATLTYQWRKYTTDIPGANSDTYTIASAQAGDRGAYSVVVSNGSGSVTSRAAGLGLTPPRLTDPLPRSPGALDASPTYAALDQSFDPTVTVIGSIPLSFQWYFDGIAIPGATSSSYTNPHMGYEDAGTYSVTANNQWMSDSSRYAFGAAVAAGQLHGLLLQKNGRLLVFGDNSFGIIGLGDSNPGEASPVLLSEDVAGVATGKGSAHSLFWKTDGTLWGMGINNFSQVGDAGGTFVFSPIQFASGVRTAAAGAAFTLFIKQDDTLWGLGNNSAGQLGNSTNDDQTTAVQIDSDVSAIAAGNAHSLFIKTDGTLWATGDNFYGQLGDLTNDDRNSPVQIATGVIAVAAGSGHSLFLKDDHTLWAMGANAYGQLGDGTETDRNAPVQIATEVVAIAAGAQHSLFVKSDGTLWSMGRNDYGQLGDGYLISQNTPVRVASGVIAADGGSQSSFFIRENGEVWTMGNVNNGRLGIGSVASGSTRRFPVPVKSGYVETVVEVQAVPSIEVQPVAQEVLPGDEVTFSVTASGDSLHAQWYKDNVAIIGAVNLFYTISSAQNADEGDYSITITNGAGEATSDAAALTVIDPPSIAAQPRNADVKAGFPVAFTVGVAGDAPFTYQWRKNGVDIEGATGATFAIPSAQTGDAGSYSVVVANAAGEATSGAATLTITEPPVITTSPASQIAVVGNPASFTVSATGSAEFTFQWYKDGVAITGATDSTLNLANVGLDDAGDYGVIVSNGSGSVYSGPGAVIDVSDGDAHSLFVTNEGKLYAMGNNEHGQLGDGTINERHTPVEIAADVVAASAGAQHSLYLKSDGTLWGMGANASGQLGNADSDDQLEPIQIASNVIAIAAGGWHTLFIRDDGKLWGVGEDTNGELGDNSGVDQTTPIEMASDVLAVAAGTYHTLYLTQDGKIWATGQNGYGQLGDGTTTERDGAVEVDGYGVPVGGQFHSFLLKFDHTLWGMGSNGYSQLGDGTTTDRHDPVEILSDLRAVAGGWLHSLFVKDDGTLWAVGSNDYGELGDGTIETRNSPVEIAASANLVAAGTTFSHFTDSFGRLWAMGSNAWGRLGDGTTDNQHSPVLVAGQVIGGATLTVVEPPAIAVAPVGQTVVAGDAVGFEVTATGTGPLTYQWYFNAEAITDATGVSYEIASAQPADAGAYSVTVTNAYGEATSDDANLTVNVPPSVVTPPMAQTVNTGDPVVFSVSVSGTGPFSYQWQKDGVDIEGATESTYEIVSAQAGDAGGYRVVVTNVAGEITSEAVALTVEGQATTPTGNNVAVAPPLVDSEGMPVSGGPTVSLDFGEVSTPGVTTLTVSEAGPEVPGNFFLGDSHILEIETTATFDGLIQIAVDYSDLTLAVDPSELMLAHFDGSEWVDITTSNDLVNHIIHGETATLSPFALIAPVSVALGDLTQEYDGTPKAATATTTPGGLTVDLTYDGSASAPTNPGEYAVEATIVDATYFGSTTGTLTINGAPIMIDSPLGQSVAEGGGVTLSANVASAPAATYQWFKGGVAITGATSSSYTIASLTPDDAGAYTVVASNAYGDAMSSAANLTVNWSRLTALSIRGLAGAGDNTLITGMVIGGSSSKGVVLRAQSSILAAFGVDGILEDPRLTLYQFNPVTAVSTQVRENDNWGGDPTMADRFASVGLSPLAEDSLDAAFATDIDTGIYTAHVTGAAGTGVVILELYDYTVSNYASRLQALSLRGSAGTGGNVMIVGIVIEGNSPARVVVRGVGPSLGDAVPQRLLDPEMLLFHYDPVTATSTQIGENDNWGGGTELTDAFSTVGLFPLDPASADAAMLLELDPGIYTVQVRGVGDTTGVVLMELYEVR